MIEAPNVNYILTSANIIILQDSETRGLNSLTVNIRQGQCRQR